VSEMHILNEIDNLQKSAKIVLFTLKFYSRVRNYFFTWCISTKVLASVYIYIYNQSLCEFR